MKPQIACPHCDRPLLSHDGKPCRTRFTRRFLFGLFAGGVAASVASRLGLAEPDWIDLFDPNDRPMIRPDWERARFAVGILSNKTEPLPVSGDQFFDIYGKSRYANPEIVRLTRSEWYTQTGLSPSGL